MADIIKVEVASSGEVWDIPGIPAPSCEDVVKSLGGGTLLDSNGLVVLQSRNLEAGKHYKLYPQVVPAGNPPSCEKEAIPKMESRFSHVQIRNTGRHDQAAAQKAPHVQRQQRM